MDLDLPTLDIVEDIAEVMDDELTIEKIPTEEEHIKHLEIEEEKKQPFIRKTVVKKKKELSEKQKAHLDKIRGMALEKRQIKARAKKEALDKVKEQIAEEHKPKYYVPKPKKTKEEKALEKEAKKKYKKHTMEVIEEVVNEEEEITPSDFIPNHKELIKKQKEQDLINQQNSFNNFMGNMENYMKLREVHEQTKQPKQVKQVKQVPIKETIKETIKPHQVPTVLQTEPENPFSNYFG